MFDFIQKLIYLVLGLHSRIFKKGLNKNLKTIYVNTTSKRAVGSAASLEVRVRTEQSKTKLENNVKVILKKYSNNPEKLLEFVKRSGTKVYKIPFANKILNIIGYEEGFVSSAKGIRALCLNFITSVFSGEKINISTTAEPMFILRNATPDNYLMIQQFHKWYAMKLALPGFDAESQENFQKFLSPMNDAKIKELSIEEILGLKEAIARDVEAINFTVELAKSTEGAKNALAKMTTGGATV